MRRNKKEKRNHKDQKDNQIDVVEENVNVGSKRKNYDGSKDQNGSVMHVWM